ncbi:AAA family ATPase [Clostridium sardiniense]|uniref:AAA family ATPase n=1 Tax=Clostridium sardiniense TaxID=29369 RepID=A0ABS7L2N1_CLOSR|nr:ParA family protein [Clostridium sardiniense]MBY0757334.1 AAA family ATPase [Clostridium sardiniense]MDQ0458506.1 chromosome partitioning protein [Clostridium sardiniense]
MKNTKVISLFNIKGGVAKTTSTANLGACLSQQNKKVLLIDLDPQSNLTKLFKSYSIDDLSIANALLNKKININEIIKQTDFENIDIIPSNIKLAFAEREILLDVSRSQQNRLSRAIKNIEENYDYILIDCPPSLNMITINSLCASDDVLVPIKIDKFALDGLEYLLDSIEEIKDEFNPDLNFKGCFVTMDTATTVNRQIKKELKNILEDKLFNTTIKQNVKVIESTFEESPVVFSSKKARASVNYKDLVKEVF